MIYHYNETPIFYTVTGAGPAVILLHGFLESSTMWSRLVPLLSVTKTVVTVDLPGHGKSGCIASIHSMEMMAQVVHSLLGDLQMESASFIGHSMGGYVGLAFLEAFREKSKAFYTAYSTTKKDAAEQMRNRERGARLVLENKELFVGTVMNRLFIESSFRNFASEIAALKKEANDLSTEGIVAAIRGMKERPDRTEVFQDFKGEKIIICGEKDPVVPLLVSKQIAIETNSELIILNGGHMSWMENSEQMLKYCT